MKKELSDGVALTTAVAAFMEEHYKALGDTVPARIEFFSKGASILGFGVDLANGEDLLNALVKGILDTGSGAVTGLIAGAALALAAPAAGAFAIGAGTVVVGFIASKSVGDYIKNGVDYVIGVSDKRFTRAGVINIEVLSANLFNTLNEHYDTLTNEPNWKIQLDSEAFTTIEYKNNTYEFKESLSSLRIEGSNLDVLLQYVQTPVFDLKTPSGTDRLVNLSNQSKSGIASLAKSDEAVLYALENLKAYAIVGDTPRANNYSDVQLQDRADFLYYNLHKDEAPTNETYIDYRNDKRIGDAKNRVIFGNDSGEVLYGGSKDDGIYGNAGDDRIYADGQNMHLSYNNGNDYVEGGKGDDIIYGGHGNDTIYGGLDSDTLYGNSGEDTLIGGDDNSADVLVGGSGFDILLGQAGADVLVGGNSLDDLYSEKTYDYLAGGTGFDTYLVSHQDVINNADRSGLIMFNDKSLSGTKTKLDENTYEDANFTYTLSGSNMIVVDKNLGEYITLENMNFTNSTGMGFNFDDSSDQDPNNSTNKDVNIYVGDATVTEGGTLEFTVGIDNTLENDLTLNVESYFTANADANDFTSPLSGTITIKAGETAGTFSIDTYDDVEFEGTEKFTFAVVGQKYTSANNEEEPTFLIINAGEGTISDNDKKTDKEIEISIASGSRYEADGAIAFTVSISEALDEEISIGYEATSQGNSLVAGHYNVVIPKGATSAELIVLMADDSIEEADEAIALNYVGFGYNGSDIKSVVGNDGAGTILDDDGDGDGNPLDDPDFTPPRRDPLVLDLDKDGFISTTSLADSTAYFDLTGDGIKEKVGWIESNDGLVAYDKNENGKIDGINEVFGNQTTSGFDELRQIADSNHDGVIDRQDELYSRLKIWQDKNQDGISQTDELISLKEAGVKSINLDAVNTNINVNGNLITEASKYTDSDGNLELAADLELEFDSRLTNIDTSTIPDYTEHADTESLPFLRAYGIVHDSNVMANIDDEFRNLAKELASDVTQVANNFEDYMDAWSGYNKMQADLQEKYNLTDTPKLSDVVFDKGGSDSFDFIDIREVA